MIEKFKLTTDRKTENWSTNSRLQLIEKQKTDQYQAAQLIEKRKLTTDRNTDNWSNIRLKWSKNSSLQPIEKQKTDRISITTDTKNSRI